MTAHSVQTSSKAGVVPTYDAVTATDKFLNSGREVLDVKNDGIPSLTVTIHSQQQCNQGSTHNLTVSVAGGAEKMIGPFETDRFNDADGYLNVDFSLTADITAAVFKR